VAGGCTLRCPLCSLETSRAALESNSSGEFGTAPAPNSDTSETVRTDPIAILASDFSPTPTSHIREQLSLSQAGRARDHFSGATAHTQRKNRHVDASFTIQEICLFLFGFVLTQKKQKVIVPTPVARFVCLW
jgi:hypothetical protein